MIKILFFASLREKLNCEQLDFELTDQHVTIAELKKQLVALHPDWQAHFTNSALLNAVNQQMAHNDTLLKIGDEVAFFPPVTGG